MTTVDQVESQVSAGATAADALPGGAAGNRLVFSARTKERKGMECSKRGERIPGECEVELRNWGTRMGRGRVTKARPRQPAGPTTGAKTHLHHWGQHWLQEVGGVIPGAEGRGGGPCRTKTVAQCRERPIWCLKGRDSLPKNRKDTGLEITEGQQRAGG